MWYFLKIPWYEKDLHRENHYILNPGYKKKNCGSVKIARLDANFAVSGAFWKYLVHDRVFIRAAARHGNRPSKTYILEYLRNPARNRRAGLMRQFRFYHSITST